MVDLKYWIAGVLAVVTFIVVLAILNDPHKPCRVTLYANDGKVIRYWDANTVLTSSGSATFTYQGEKVSISGTFVIEPKERTKK